MAELQSVHLIYISLGPHLHINRFQTGSQAKPSLWIDKRQTLKWYSGMKNTRTGKGRIPGKFKQTNAKAVVLILTSGSNLGFLKSH